MGGLKGTKELKSKPRHGGKPSTVSKARSLFKTYLTLQTRRRPDGAACKTLKPKGTTSLDVSECRKIDFAPLRLSSTTWIRIETSIIRRRVMLSHSACNLIGSSSLHALHQELRMERHNPPIGDERHNLPVGDEAQRNVHWE